MGPIAATGGLRRWIRSLVMIAALIVATVLIATHFFPGDGYFDKIENAYRLLWESTTRRQYTEIIQERPWLFIAPAVGILIVSGWQLPTRQWARALLIYMAVGIGFVGGHVFW